ncbi:hypothetical protein [Spirosoma spitsbergense]|uniref:hypothetical protein n=1 Tax=Spirosoma spitsbergense TaxID=431554 RepID=UPI0003608D6E|nr:hypothetical protein [Spirosoma spitsbergense]
MAGLLQSAQVNWQHGSIGPTRQLGLIPVGAATMDDQYDRELQFNIYRFLVSAPDSGRVRTVTIKAYRGELLLTKFTVRVDGAVSGTDVADLDGNRFPELYLFSTSDGSGSFGRVYAWQFMPERKADISLPRNWLPEPVQGYMGHDSLWVENNLLCRRYPIYQAGDANATSSGGYRLMRYQLKPAGTGYALTAKQE